jgi:nicotinamide mononucleotide (NMN) deamidase PncC
MAEGVRERTGAGYAVATTGEAGPDSATGAPPGTVFIGIAGGAQPADARQFIMPGERDRVRGFTTNAALDLLRRRILAAP